MRRSTSKTVKNYIVEADAYAISKIGGIQMLGNKSIDKRLFNKLFKDKTLMVEAKISSVFSANKTMQWSVRKASWYDRLRKWLAYHGIGADLRGWSIRYSWKTKRYSYELDFSAAHWNDMLAAFFRILRPHYHMDLWNFHLFSMYYTAPDFMSDNYNIHITIVNFSASLYWSKK